MAVASIPDDPPAYIAPRVSALNISRPAYTHRLLSSAGKSQTQSVEIKWYLKPLFYYVVWPVCGAAAGALIAYLIGLAYTELFFNLK